VLSGERPAYSEKDVLSAMDTDTEFRMLYGEVQRLLGRTLNTEELKILLGFVRYLGLPCEVISVLVTYCRDRARMKGKFRNPSLRTIEKEAYHWAEEGIDTMEEAAAYIHRWNQRHSRLARLLELLQIRGRSLTPAEERYADNWLEMGFEDEVIRMAYEKTCVNTGGLSWPYMNKILTSWKNAGLLTAQQVKNGDKKGTAAGQRQLDEDERAAIARMMQEV
jgi:DnaD/phage-associated family protein